jgi:diguanylate cyclase (GGDEF)-like protein/PAS domain S-box-containing protein
MTTDSPQVTEKPSTVHSIEFRTLAEDAPVMLWQTDIEGAIIFSNTKWKQFVGARKVESEGGNAWYEALHPDDRKHCLDIFRQAFISHDAFEMEYRLRRLDGEYRHVLDTGEPYVDSNKMFAGFIGSSTDITERKKSEEQLQRSNAEMQQYNAEMEIINNLNSYLQVCRTLEETHPIIFYYARELFPSCSGSIYLLNENKTMVESVVTWGENTAIQLPVITSDDCWSLRQGKNHTVHDTQHGLVCNHLTECPEFGYTCVPIIAQGEMVGMLHLQFPKYEAHEAEDAMRQREARQRLANMTADNLALALVSLKLREALEIQSIRDPLTQLFNRRYMEETLEREFSRCSRSKSDLGLLILDIDHFKKYNDDHGHDAGDMVLIEFANMLNDKLRDGDVACRYGGEEFVLIMPGAPLNVLEQRAELIRNDLKRLVINYQGKVLNNITVSIGISSYPLHAENPKALIKAADIALYEAKETGRDRAIVAKTLNNRANDENQTNIKIASVK